MSTINSPYKRVFEMVDPIFEGVALQDDMFSGRIDDRPAVIPTLGLDLIDGIQMPESGKVDIYQFTTTPSIHIGDLWAYEAGDSSMETGYIKMKKLTQQLRLSEDRMDRILQNGVNSIVKRGLEKLQKDENLYMRQALEQWIIDPFAGATTSIDYDSEYRGALMKSDSGTLSNPSDINATPGTPATVTGAWSGTAQATNIVTTFKNIVARIMYKEDSLTHSILPLTNRHIGMHPMAYDILNANTEILNGTTGQRSEKTQLQLLETSKYTVVTSVYFDTTYAGADNDTTPFVVYCNPKINFVIWVNNPPEGSGVWTEWNKETNKKGNITTYSWEKHKKVEIGVQVMAYGIRASSGVVTFYKPLAIFTCKPFDDT